MSIRTKKHVLIPFLISIPLLTALAAITTLNGCATLEQMIQKPTATFSGMRLTDADLVQSTAVFIFNIHNPNPINIRAGRITYDLKLNGRKFVNGQLNQGITLAAGSTSPLQVPITLAYLDFFESISQLWQAKNADYALTGGFTVGPFVIPFQAHGILELPKMPKISLEAIEIRKFSLFGASLNGRIKMENPNAFDLLFKRMDYALNLGGTSFGRASALPHGPIGKKSNSVINFAFDVSFAQLGHSAYQLLQGAKADFALDGGLIFDQPNRGERKVPFNLSGQVPFRKFSAN
jgi:LEA14-like dessication related protein